MEPFDAFTSYELTRDKKNKKPTRSGCSSGCLVVVLAFLILIVIILI